MRWRRPMDRLLRVVLQKLIRAGNLKIVTATGSSFTFGDGTGAAIGFDQGPQLVAASQLLVHSTQTEQSIAAM